MKYTIITTVLAAFLLSPATFAHNCTGANDKQDHSKLSDSKKVDATGEREYFQKQDRTKK